MERKGLSLGDIDYVLLHERWGEGFSKLGKILGFEYRAGKENATIEPLPATSSMRAGDQSKVTAGSIMNYIFRRDVTPLRDRNDQYIFLHELVESNWDIRRKIKKIYTKDFALYEKARSRAL